MGHLLETRDPQIPEWFTSTSEFHAKGIGFCFAFEKPQGWPWSFVSTNLLRTWSSGLFMDTYLSYSRWPRVKRVLFHIPANLCCSLGSSDLLTEHSSGLERALKTVCTTLRSFSLSLSSSQFCSVNNPFFLLCINRGIGEPKLKIQNKGRKELSASVALFTVTVLRQLGEWASVSVCANTQCLAVCFQCLEVFLESTGRRWAAQVTVMLLMTPWA